MDAIEVQRQENIKRNHEHLRELGIFRTQETVRVKPKQPAAKRRKIVASQPSRVSARIASNASAPVYKDDAEDEHVSRPTKVARSKGVKETPKNTDNQTSVGSSRISGEELESLRTGWTSWTSTADPPVRDEDSTFHFSSHPEFTPNKSPEEMLREGCFGGSYYRPLNSKRLGITIADDYKELPFSWLAGLSIDTFVASPQYDPDVNKFKVSCGQSIEEWEAAGWINHEYDVRGWFQWYCRFFMGRRCDDDERQVGRWKRCVGETGRWRRMLIKKYASMGIKEVFDDGEDESNQSVSPVMHQTCFHWALEIRQNILDHYWKTGK
ncbi:MAG: hypothetical protein LQ350_000780 [Teloschistes chrysophthalmus]|nr:MAG: hypothetical protein LQ350_000780 [Niorma chrysophthalma]